MQIKLIWQSKDYMYLGPHKWNINIRIGSDTTPSRNNWVGPFIVSWTSVNDCICDAYKLFRFGPHMTSWTGQQNLMLARCANLTRCANSLGPNKYRINTCFLSKHDVNVKRYWDNIVPIMTCLLGYGHFQSIVHTERIACINFQELGAF